MDSNCNAPPGANNGARLNLTRARDTIGEAWGLGRSLTKAELARALRLTPDYLGRLEGGAPMSGPVLVAIKALLWGYPPDNMDDVIKPGYPRGPVR